jgi:hypothetical protein
MEVLPFGGIFEAEGEKMVQSLCLKYSILMLKVVIMSNYSL